MLGTWLVALIQIVMKCYFSNCDINAQMFGVISSKVPAFLKKILQIFEWNPSKFEEFNANSNVLIQPFELISPNSKLFSINIWLNFFKIHFQNTKKEKRKEQEENLRPFDPYSDAVPLYQFEFLRKKGEIKEDYWKQGYFWRKFFKLWRKYFISWH